MSTTTMTIRTDKEVKFQAQQIFSELGMDMTTAINVFLRQAIRQNGFPFPVTLPASGKLTREVMDDIANDRNLHGPFNNVESLMDDLNA
ncbi:type II toxin-antitoxin system RelB/DinJ family antitoxin [uncultured Mailhella sp.]|uniref:type II toxin-antitoxin system RelB/DinJ family antitoxin n=1 Tax=uncultured Mailhella sp. TaxID=1981031 RepID=UPI00320B0D50